MKPQLFIRPQFVVMLFIFLASIWRLDSVPPVWWDEGWTLSIARNWLKEGHYVRLLEGQPEPAALGASPIVTAFVYFSFRLFGIGLIQARMVGVVFSILDLMLLYLLASRLYNRSIALVSMLALIFLPAYIELFPPYMGRQVLGEMPALCFLLAGYTSILYLWERPFWWMCITIVSWALALSTKLQVLPFWICSMLVLVSMAIRQHKWMMSVRWCIVIAASFLGSRVLTEVSQLLLQSKVSLSEPIAGLYQVTALVISIPSRLFALIVTVSFGIPTLIGLCYGVWRLCRRRNHISTDADEISASLLFLALSWLVWFAFLSVGWIRYIFPPVFIGSIFLAVMIYECTEKFDVAYTIRQAVAALGGRGFNKQAMGALFVVGVIVTSLPRTAMALYKTYILDADTSAQRAAAFLNSQTPKGSLIETYDSELFFLLNRPYHYPPDQVHVELIRRRFLYEGGTQISYDPLAAHPDYLVVGPHSKQWRLYDDVLKNGGFRLVRSFTRYQIYERVRR